VKASLTGSIIGNALLVLGLSMLRSEEHTSELQSRFDLVCRLLLEKKKRKQNLRGVIRFGKSSGLYMIYEILWRPYAFVSFFAGYIVLMWLGFISDLLM